MDSDILVKKIISKVFDRKAIDVLSIDVNNVSSYADYFIICSGTSDRHVQAIAEGVANELKNEEQVNPLGIEGLQSSQWVLVDYGDVILHVFHEYTRNIYDLEGLWRDVDQVVISHHSDE